MCKSSLLTRSVAHKRISKRRFAWEPRHKSRKSEGPSRRDRNSGGHYPGGRGSNRNRNRCFPVPGPNRTSSGVVANRNGTGCCGGIPVRRRFHFWVEFGPSFGNTSAGNRTRSVPDSLLLTQVFTPLVVVVVVGSRWLNRDRIVFATNLVPVELEPNRSIAFRSIDKFERAGHPGLNPDPRGKAGGRIILPFDVN